MGKPETTFENFMQRVDKTGEIKRISLGPCWVWMGGTNKDGYGRIRYRGATVSAHRLSWYYHYRDIPDGMSVLHRCDNPACVNPSHLFLGTQLDNVRDCASKGRRNYARGNNSGARKHPEKLARGESHGNSKMTNLLVLELRKLYDSGTKIGELAKKFDLTYRGAMMIAKRMTWKHVL